MSRWILFVRSGSLVLAGLVLGSVALSGYSDRPDLGSGVGFWSMVSLLAGAGLFLTALSQSLRVR